HGVALLRLEVAELGELPAHVRVRAGACEVVVEEDGLRLDPGHGEEATAGVRADARGVQRPGVQLAPAADLAVQGHAPLLEGVERHDPPSSLRTESWAYPGNPARNGAHARPDRLTSGGRTRK